MNTTTSSQQPWAASVLIFLFTVGCIVFSIRNLGHDLPEIIPVEDYVTAEEAFVQSTDGTSVQIVTPKTPSFEIHIPVHGDQTKNLWLMAQLRSDLELTINGTTKVVSATHQSQIGLYQIASAELTDDSVLSLQGNDGAPPSLVLVILAPMQMTAESVAAFVLQGDPDMGSDVGMIILMLLVSGFCLNLIARAQLAESLRNGAALLIMTGLIVLTFSYLAKPGPSPLQPAEDKRQGVERAIDHLLDMSLGSFSTRLMDFLPNQVVYDDVPAHLQHIDGSISVEVHRADHPADYPLISESLLGGVITDTQNLDWIDFRHIVQVMLLGLLVFWVTALKWHRRWLTVGYLTLASVLSLLLTYRVSYGWDEFFVNLRHAWVLLEFGTYSINPGEVIEASVDFLPLIATAFMGLFGVPLPDGLLIMSGLGNVLVTVFGFLIAKSLTGSRSFALLVAVVMGCYPNIVWIGGTGFTAGTLTGAMVAAAYLLLFSDRRYIGLVILSLLTLIRTEGVLFAALLMSYTHVLAPRIDANESWQESIRRALIEGTLVASPFLVSVVIRWTTYGELVPTPITFKNTMGDISYAQHGIARFFETISVHDLHLLFIVVLTLACFLLFSHPKRSRPARNTRHALALSMISVLFILPYFSGGGDWFPTSWNRYGQVANVMTLLMALCLFYNAARDLTGKHPGVTQKAFTVICLLAFVTVYVQETRYRPKSMYRVTYDHLKEPYEHFWTRVDQLAGLGMFLKEVLPEDAVVASPEEATIMYYSEHQMMGLLGISNPSIATRDIQPMHPGSVVHRKRGHAAVFDFRPDIIAIKEPFWFGEHKTWQQIEHSIKSEMLSPLNTNVGYISLGSFEALRVMGYQYIAVAFDDRVYAFFAHESIRDELKRNLGGNGFQQIGNVVVDYRVDPYLTERYLPGVPELIHLL